jgi:hypothetical protein
VENIIRVMSSQVCANIEKFIMINALRNIDINIIIWILIIRFAEEIEKLSNYFKRSEYYNCLNVSLKSIVATISENYISHMQDLFLCEIACIKTPGITSFVNKKPECKFVGKTVLMTDVMTFCQNHVIRLIY